MTAINKIRNIFDVGLHKIDLPKKKVKEIISRHKADPWFYYILAERGKRWDVWKPCVWIDKNCEKDKLIFETGCGSGLNLIWLGQHGFTKLYGSDIQIEVLNAAKEIAFLARLKVDFWQDDCLQPQKLPEKADIIIALNWTSLLEQFDLNLFLSIYKRILPFHGYIVIDVIDRSYDSVPNNQYLTSDWKKPVQERRPSEYIKRFSYEDVSAAAKNADFEIYETITEKQIIPKVVYILRKN